MDWNDLGQLGRACLGGVLIVGAVAAVFVLAGLAASVLVRLEHGGRRGGKQRED